MRFNGIVEAKRMRREREGSMRIFDGHVETPAPLAVGKEKTMTSSSPLLAGRNILQNPC